MRSWISKALAMAIHDRQLAEHGGSSGVRDEQLLESALARPQQRDSYSDPPPDLAELAASLCFGLVKNHPFVDGNKRTATVCMETFIRLNGGQLLASDADLFPRILALADGRLSEADFAQWLRDHLQEGQGQPLHEPAPAAYG